MSIPDYLGVLSPWISTKVRNKVKLTLMAFIQLGSKLSLGIQTCNIDVALGSHPGDTVHG
ncbi:predicted protein [Sclerotinia sclerotiorum 1980 UF-70]|uniref:Uncharacterized protein n=1 Tax=Sclerotinia sclerotiorum (strain ATCC 18683 / 1980 / Ss-1) TaxID=665079 RepID=A7E838_SCLS1|nr:predicted protein [Sclerotinia sclerotiorum 1980 UF-70]EDN96540.1 predicted protein [Sclerotinia sclerotiorum 1980 UF-70]